MGYFALGGGLGAIGRAPPQESFVRPERGGGGGGQRREGGDPPQHDGHGHMDNPHCPAGAPIPSTKQKEMSCPLMQPSGPRPSAWAHPVRDV